MEILLAVGVAAALVELVIGATWQPFYFTTGISIFRKSTHLSRKPELSIVDLNDRFSGTLWPPLEFRKIGPGQIAFREAFMSFHFLPYTPVMHGLIRYKQRQGKVEVIGYGNWFVPLFIILFAVYCALRAGREGGIDITFAAFPVVIFGLVYFVQFVRFNRVYKAAVNGKDAWS